LEARPAPDLFCSDYCFYIEQRDPIMMEATTIEKIRKMVNLVRPHDDFTAWIRAIQKARILQLGPEDAWIDDENIIQVRRMREKELESRNFLPESDDESDDESQAEYFEDFLDVIKLPLPLPELTEKEFPAPQFLFFRPDEYALFKCFGQQNWCILTGNEGVSKSWFHWKFILLCYRQDLFHRCFSPLRSRVEGEDEESLSGPKTEDQTTTDVQTSTEDRTSTEDQTSTEQAQAEEVELSIKKLAFQTSMEKEQVAQIDQSELKQSELFIPNLIVRTLAGKRTLLFFMDQTSDVFYVEHSLKQLHFFTDESSTILWEPASGSTPSYYHELQARMIATVPSHENLFQSFMSQAQKFYMPCPSELQLRLMGQIFRKFSLDLQNFPNDEEIHEHVRKFGPFVHMSLLWSKEERDRFEQTRERQLESVCSTDESLNSAVMSPVKYMETSRVKTGSIHCVARYVVNRDKSDRFLGYTRPQCSFCSAEIQYMLTDCMRSYNCAAVDQLMAVLHALDRFT